jgi:hypothetical protein
MVSEALNSAPIRAATVSILFLLFVFYMVLLNNFELDSVIFHPHLLDRFPDKPSRKLNLRPEPFRNLSHLASKQLPGR